MPSDRVTVVIPTYNERENLPDISKAVTGQGYELLVVDDASPDGTGDLADRLATEDRRVSVLHRSSKEGLGPAYAAGFDRALEDGADIVIEMDADFSHDPADLPRLVGAIGEGADLAIGSRYVPGGTTPDWPLTRRVISKGGNLYARMMLGIPTRDATAGFRAFRAGALRSLPYREAQSSGYAFQVEMAMRAHEGGLNVVEVPISFRDRTRGQSKMGTGIVVEAMRLVTVWGWKRVVRGVRSWGR
ncbi:MAG TPA: polyprenol monophosphomannose synthase [Acidimicrobiia bacterium]|nr:polyprenol monophosphomannose synthase [Acidimicrobiia bacterium]